MNTVGFVAIARNEGERLKSCLTSLKKVSDRVVYVDSGSTDGSVEWARNNGCEVVELDTSVKFTMARARNAGWRHLLDQWPETELIHFLDGDCELLPAWMTPAIEFMGSNASAAAVCGRRRERHPEKSLYNRLCNTEWNTPVGEARSCGGDALMRRRALEDVGGYNESLIAGEEPEMCLRMRNQDWKIYRIEHDMTLHDANILRFGQWWKRCMRGGYGAADVARRTAEDTGLGEVLFQSQVKSAKSWQILTVVMLAATAASLVVGWWPLAILIFLALLGLFGLQSLKIALGARQRADSFSSAIEYGVFTMLAKIPQSLGISKYNADRRAQRSAELIEYKS